MTKLDSSNVSEINLRTRVREAVDAQAIWDIHTHVYPPTFGTTLGGASNPSDPTGLLLWGIDELLTYHYLVAEVFRVVPQSVLSYDAFWSLSKQQQAEVVLLTHRLSKNKGGQQDQQANKNPDPQKHRTFTFRR